MTKKRAAEIQLLLNTGKFQTTHAKELIHGIMKLQNILEDVYMHSAGAAAVIQLELEGGKDGTKLQKNG